MAFGLTEWFAIGILIIMVMAVVSNSGQTGTANIQTQFDRIGCPMPEIGGLWNNTGTIVHGNGTYNYMRDGTNGAIPPNTLTCTDIHTLEGVDYYYGMPTLPFAGWGFFIGDWISELIGNKVSAFFTIIAYVLTPINFDVFGFTTEDISGIALMFVIGLYIFAYIPIGVFIYKAISPWVGL